VRALEQKIAVLPPDMTGGCAMLPDPGDDPPIGGNGTPSGDTGIHFDDGAGYSDEDGRARVFCDLLHMAFACDLTRVATLMLCHVSSCMNVGPVTASGYLAGVHQLGHEDFGTPAIAEFLAWAHGHFAYLVAKLRDTPVGAGRLLDHAAMVLTYEGGAQHDDYTGLSPHTTGRMACLVAGRAGGLATGQHIATDDVHPARVLKTAREACGVEAALGEHTSIPELLG
jgi:hypothetical protein